jgi:hypothetical protein
MNILDEEIPLIDNIKRSLRHYWFFWVLLLISVGLDYFSTLYFMHFFGVEKEANLIVRWLAQTLGVYHGVAIGKSLQLVSAVGFSSLSFKYSRAILMMLIFLNLLAVIHNLR